MSVVRHSLPLVLAIVLMAVGFPATSSPTLAQGAATAPSEVVNLRLGQTPGRTRLVFDLSQPVTFAVNASDPGQLVLTLPNTTSQFDHGSVALAGTPIERVFATATGESALQYRIQLAHPVRHNIFVLKPYQDSGHRLVLDLETVEVAATVGASNAPAQPVTVPAGDTANRRKATSPRSATRLEVPAAQVPTGEWSGYLGLESRLFFSDPQFPQQEDHAFSVALEPQFYVDWADGSQRFAFRPFARYDSADDERSHVDLREFYWRLEYADLVVKLGLDVVFWGVTESQHLIDVINQTDLVENIDGEDKLGQPMLNLDYASAWGTWQAYVLPYFRERTFPSAEGRLRTEPFVDADDAMYESGDEEKHIDFALRWSHYIGDWDIGVAHFSGTSRTPVFVPSTNNARPAFAPLYLQIDQTSLDIQATKGAWLWKLEALYNDNSLEDYAAAVGGFEYTWYGAGGGDGDIGWLLEYHFDERDENPLAPLQNDVFVGVRYTGNDLAGTRLLAGVIVDADSNATFGNLEAVRRLGEKWTVTLEARFFSSNEEQDLLRFWDEDDYVEFLFTRYF